ncbi:hypothetical protein CVT24_010721 [Panaeolus cyanescens]|uniref:HNH nuclease domain-containing protein n=1 Tax=Panaeolus cyanescens TaxID=181874 RepID=A0A409YW21_9AGAR|nr:hypothetical protein CVT24_010721 [Panaeolus cyanescens]
MAHYPGCAMKTLIKNVSKAASKRAQSVDPNSGRCVIENCSNTQGVHAVRVFDCDIEMEPDVLGSLEWAWGMIQGSLSLDTRRNILFVGESVYELYRSKKWALLPMEEDVAQFFDKFRIFTLGRERFPKIERDTFQYTLLPLDALEDVYLSRQSMEGARDVTIHDFPYNTFPVITSHVDPRFVILHLSQTVFGDTDVNVRMELIEKYPYLDEAWSLFETWTGGIPTHALKDKTYICHSSGHDGTSTVLVDSTDCDGSRTPVQRNRPLPKPTFSMISSASGDEYDDEQEEEELIMEASSVSYTASLEDSEEANSSIDCVRGLHVNKRHRYLTSVELSIRKENVNMEPLTWTSERISEWAKECTPQASSERPPVRRSTRTRKKPKRFL